MDTICRDCIFATWEENTQKDCSFSPNRIDKLEENGATIIGQDDGVKRYLLIKDRICTACRNEEWGKANPKRKWKEIVKEKNQIKVDIIITVGSNNNIEEVKNSVELAYNQKIKPNSVVVANASGTRVSTDDIVFFLKDRAEGPWRVEELDWQKAAKFCKGTYHAVFTAGSKIPSDFIHKLNKFINEDMKRFVVVLPNEDGSGLVLQKCGLSFNEILEAAHQTDSMDMVVKYEDL